MNPANQNFNYPSIEEAAKYDSKQQQHQYQYQQQGYSNQQGYPQYPNQQPYSQYPQQGYQPQMDVESQEESFQPQPKAQEHVWHGFIRKVYGVLSVMLLITFGFTLLMIRDDSFKKFTKTSYGTALLVTCTVFAMALICLLVCNRKVARSSPINYVVVFSFTCLQSVLVAFVSAQYPKEKVYLALALTFLATASLTAYAWFARPSQVLVCVPILIVAGVLLLCSALVLLFVKSKVLYLFYCVVGVLFYSVFLVVDTYMITRSGEYTVDDWAIAAVMLYIDIIQLFLYILKLLGNND